jgi:hypothetical protein
MYDNNYLFDNSIIYFSFLNDLHNLLGVLKTIYVHNSSIINQDIVSRYIEIFTSVNFRQYILF